MSSQDWMTHDHVPEPSPPATYPLETLWTLRKRERIARALVRRLPTGRDLVCDVDGRWRRTHLFRLEESAALMRLAEDWRHRFLALGWV